MDYFADYIVKMQQLPLQFDIISNIGIGMDYIYDNVSYMAECTLEFASRLSDGNKKDIEARNLIIEKWQQVRNNTSVSKINVQTLLKKLQSF